MLLAIDTSTHWASIGLFSGSTMLSCQEWEIGQQHSSQIFNGISQTLAAAQASQSDVSAIAVATGPGSFNGLRVAVTVAKTLAYVWNVPLVGIATLDGYAQLQVQYTDATHFIAVSEAGREELYLSWYDLKDGIAVRAGHVTIATIVSLPAVAVPTIITGDVSEAHQGQLQSQLGSLAHLAMPMIPSERVRGLGALAIHQLAAGAVSEVMSLQPLYVRQPNITSSLRHSLPGGQQSGGDEVTHQDIQV